MMNIDGEEFVDVPQWMVEEFARGIAALRKADHTIHPQSYRALQAGLSWVLTKYQNTNSLDAPTVEELATKHGFREGTISGPYWELDREELFAFANDVIRAASMPAERPATVENATEVQTGERLLLAVANLLAGMYPNRCRPNGRVENAIRELHDALEVYELENGE